MILEARDFPHIPCLNECACSVPVTGTILGDSFCSRIYVKLYDCLPS